MHCDCLFVPAQCCRHGVYAWLCAERAAVWNAPTRSWVCCCHWARPQQCLGGCQLRPLSFMPCSCPPVMTRCCGGIVALLCRPDPYSVHADCAAHCCTPTCWLFVLLLCMYAALLLHHPTYDSMQHAGMKLLVLSYLVWLCVLNVSAPSVLRILPSVVVTPLFQSCQVRQTPQQSHRVWCTQASCKQNKTV